MINDTLLYTKRYRKVLLFGEFVLRISIRYCTSPSEHSDQAVVSIPLSPFVSASELHHEGTRPTPLATIRHDIEPIQNTGSVSVPQLMF
jgi:hypothetical protein